MRAIVRAATAGPRCSRSPRSTRPCPRTTRCSSGSRPWPSAWATCSSCAASRASVVSRSASAARQRVIGRDVAGEVAAVARPSRGTGSATRCTPSPTRAASPSSSPCPSGSSRRGRPRSTPSRRGRGGLGHDCAAGLRLVELGPGAHLLVNGASGGVGGFAVQLAKATGAEVTGVCRASKADHVRAIGADHVIDYETAGLHGGRGALDVVFDLVADHPLGRVRRSLTRRGTLILSSGRGGRVLGPLGRMAAASITSPFVSQRLRTLAARPAATNSPSSPVASTRARCGRSSTRCSRSSAPPMRSPGSRRGRCAERSSSRSERDSAAPLSRAAPPRTRARPRAPTT